MPAPRYVRRGRYSRGNMKDHSVSPETCLLDTRLIRVNLQQDTQAVSALRGTSPPRLGNDRNHCPGPAFGGYPTMGVDDVLFLQRLLLHYGIYRRYPLRRWPAFKNAWRIAFR